MSRAAATPKVRCPGCLGTAPVPPGAAAVVCPTCRREFAIADAADAKLPATATQNSPAQRNKFRRRGLIVRRTRALYGDPEATKRDEADDEDEDDETDIVEEVVIDV